MQEMKQNSVREAWILCLILGIVMINFPFVHIFNVEQTFFGIPELVLYFFLGWPISIIVIWFFVYRAESEERNDPDSQDIENQ